MEYCYSYRYVYSPASSPQMAADHGIDLLLPEQLNAIPAVALSLFSTLSEGATNARISPYPFFTR